MADFKKNDSLYTDTTQTRLEIKVLQYNVDQAMREERVEETKWMRRRDRIRALILEVDPDIAFLQEFRILPDVAETPQQFLASFSDYEFYLAHRNPGPLAFGQAIMWKKSRFYPGNYMKFWLSNHPRYLSDTWSVSAGGTTGFGYIVSGLHLHPVENGKQVRNADAVPVFVTHFGLEEELKTKSCECLLNIVDAIVGFRAPSNVIKDRFLVCGDFNFFPDRDGAKQRAILTKYWKDLGANAQTLTGRHVEGTFVGYEHDEFKADLKNMVSRLDHVFGGKDVELLAPPLLYNKMMLVPEPLEFSTRQYPSDHLPLVVRVAVPLKNVSDDTYRAEK